MDTMEWKIGDHKCRHLPLISDFYTHDRSLLPRLLHTARIMWVCSTSSSDSVNSAQSANPQKNQSHQQHHSACLQTYMGKYTKPPKKLLKKTWKQVVMVADWLRFPRVNYGGGLMDLDTNRHGIPIPQGWITPTTRNNPPTPFWIYPRTHQEANFVVICEMTDIKSPQCC